MSPPPPAPSARSTRTSTSSQKTREDIIGTPGLDVRDAETAKAHLLVGAYMIEGVEVPMGMLSAIALQLSQLPRLTKPAIEGFRALAFLIDEASQKQLAEAITKYVEKSLNTVLGHVETALGDASTELAAAAISTNNTMDEFRDESHKLMEGLEEAVAAVTEAVGAMPITQEARNEGPTPNEERTYADMVKKAVPPIHADTITRGEMQKRRVRLVKAAGLETDGMADLTEKQLVEKANVALELMEVQAESRPDGTRFVGATKLRGIAGGALYELNSEEAATWLKEDEVMKAFTAKMGSTADYKAQTYEVMVDWVPTTFDPQQIGVLEMIEKASEIQSKTIAQAKWIKPITMRGPNQKTALAVFSFYTRESANQAIRDGMFVEGKRVWARKQLQEPRRCLKCQCFGEHRAANCTSIHEVCGRCGKQHRTNECHEADQNTFECSNCRTAKNGKQAGHGAADRQCPVFLERVERANRQYRENGYRFYCTKDPRSWEPITINNSNEPWIQETMADNNHRRGYGRLAGGEIGTGGGRRAEDYSQTDDITWTQAKQKKGKGRAETGGNSGYGGERTSDRGYRGEGTRGGIGNRSYRQGIQSGPRQTTLPDAWRNEGGAGSWAEQVDRQFETRDGNWWDEAAGRQPTTETNNV
jgi:hypothetical protein